MEIIEKVEIKDSKTHAHDLLDIIIGLAYRDLTVNKEDKTEVEKFDKLVDKACDKFAQTMFEAGRNYEKSK